MTEVKSLLKSQKISAQKARVVLNGIRGNRVEQAIDKLNYSTTKGARLVYKALSSAIANAENNHGLDIDNLKVLYAYADESFTIKRMRCRARGRGAKILKRRCHITVIVGEAESGDK